MNENENHYTVSLQWNILQ